MSFTVRIDDPVEQRITSVTCTIRGWCSTENSQSLKALCFLIGTSQLPYHRQFRPDVEATMPGIPCVGFLIRLDLSFYMSAVRNHELLIHVVCGGNKAVPVRFEVSPKVITNCLAAASSC